MIVNYHLDKRWVGTVLQSCRSGGHMIQNLCKCCSLDLLCSKVAHGVTEVEDVTTLLYLLEHKLIPLCWRCICTCTYLNSICESSLMIPDFLSKVTSRPNCLESPRMQGICVYYKILCPPYHLHMLCVESNC